jgi:restriction system protein
MSAWWLDAAQVAGVLAALLAITFAVRRVLRARLANSLAASRSASAFAALSLDEFQVVVGDAFRAQGYVVRELHGLEASDGIDLEISRGGEHYLVECSHWSAYKVPVAVVRELYLKMETRGASGAFLVTAGTFTEDAKVFVQGTNISLIDGRKLFDLIGNREGEPAAQA